ncbi:Serine-arginine protein 55 [Gryllus bimaculatus]|nr:Serine-arginine protein 55 [Gryllus bimaculatus]
MSKLYVGNLPADVNEAALRQLFQEHSLTCTTILIKRGGYAFVDCPDQSTADRAIDKLNGYNFNGSVLVVEPSVAGGGKKSFASNALGSRLAKDVKAVQVEGVTVGCGDGCGRRFPPTLGRVGVFIKAAEAVASQSFTLFFLHLVLRCCLLLSVCPWLYAGAIAVVWSREGGRQDSPYELVGNGWR